MAEDDNKDTKDTTNSEDSTTPEDQGGEASGETQEDDRSGSTDNQEESSSDDSSDSADNSDSTGDDSGDDSSDQLDWTTVNQLIPPQLSELAKLAEDKGVQPQALLDILGDALQEQDVTKLNKKALKEAFPDDYPVYLEYYQNTLKKTVADLKDLTKEAYQAAGGKRNWEKVQNMVKDFPESEKSGIASLINQGGFVAKTAIKGLIERYNSQEGISTVGNEQDVSGVAGGKKEGYINQRDFSEQMIHAVNSGNTKEVQALSKLRAASRNTEASEQG